ncbi:MAG: hypothetical protein LQ352_003958 [Teloschistes flavicans]|nr:MAG: hypothetical protein LQ352_003958 [Teloschistes flavicans]
MSQDTYFSLDWRDAPSSKAIVEEIMRIFKDLDGQGAARMCLSASTAQGTVRFVEGEDGVAMIRRRNNKTVRTMNTKAKEKYFAELFPLAHTLARIQQERQTYKSRMIEYKEVNPESHMRLETVKRLILDLALTIKVHPTALGIKGEGHGQFYVPHNARVEVEQVADMFKYLNRNASAPSGFIRQRKFKEGVSPIPDNVLRLGLVETMVGNNVIGKVDAVVIIEHRNLDEALIKQGLGCDHIILIMTGGYPDSATKEFLHLLSTNAGFKRKPFLFLADHDPAGFAIFQTLKYGSKTSAWVNPISVCPQLEYAGPTVDDLRKSAELSRIKWEQQHKANFPRATDAEVKKAADDWQRMTEKRIEAKLSNATLKEKERLRSFERLGWLQRQTLLKEEVKKMKQGKGIFRFANLAEAGAPNLIRFVESKVKQYCPSRVAYSQPVELFASPATRAFRDLSQSLVSQDARAATTQGDVEAVNAADVQVSKAQAKKQLVTVSTTSAIGTGKKVDDVAPSEAESEETIDLAYWANYKF